MLENAFSKAIIRQKQWQIPALVMIIIGIMLLPAEEVRWKYGMLVGATAGITIGMVLGIIGSSSPVLIASYAMSGMIAGILSKFGKLGVIIGFFSSLY